MAVSQRTVKARVKVWQKRCLLSDWTVAVLFKDKLRVGNEPAQASTNWNRNYQAATLTFDNPTLDTLSAEGLDHLIAHEFQHVIDAREDDALSDTIGHGGSVYKAWEQANEANCDHRASVLVEAYRRKRDRHISK